MDFFHEIFQYRFLTHALVACILSGVACGVAGTYVVSRRLVFLSGGITHASFGGIGIAYYFGLNPIGGAMVFALLSALGIEIVSTRQRIREDSAIGIVWAVGMAIGIAFISLTPGYAPNLMSFLFGTILTVTRTDLWALGALTFFILLLFTVWMRPILYVAFDSEYARSQGLPVRFISCLMAVVVAATIVLSIRVAGIVLLISLLTLPPVIVNALTRSYRRIMWYSVAVAAGGNLAGLWLSYCFDIPAGATTIFVLAFALIAVKLVPLCRRKNTGTACTAHEKDR